MIQKQKVKKKRVGAKKAQKKQVKKSVSGRVLLRSSKKKTKEFFVKQTFEEYISITFTDRKKLGGVYLWSLFFERFFAVLKVFLKKSFKFGMKFSYRATAILAITFLIYGIFPTALSAPQSRTITTKAEWDAGDFSGTTSVNSTDSIQMEPAGSWTARAWTPPEDVIAYGHTSVMVGNYLYAFRGYSDNAFWRYDTEKNSWSNLASLPQAAYYGADMVYNENSGEIYATFGGYSQKFYSYNIENNEWTNLSDILDTPWTGAALESDGNSIFMSRGNASTDFWEYQIVEKRWRGRAPVSLTVSTGGDLVNGYDGNLYIVRGGNSLNFYRYNILANRWYSVADDAHGGGALSQLPSTGCTGTTCAFNYEQKGVYRDGKFYFMRAHNTSTYPGFLQSDFLQYDISGNAWTILSTDPTPQLVNYSSLTFNEEEDLIYAFRSNGTTDLWKFDPEGVSGSKWVGPKQISDTAGTLQAMYLGSNVIWNGLAGVNSKLYTFQGNNTANFFVYNVSNNSWTTGAPNPGFNIRNDMKGTSNGAGTIYMPRYNDASIIQTFNGTTWTAMPQQPTGALATDGAGLTFVGNDLYYIRGGANACMYKYNSTTTSWGSCIPTAVTKAGTTTTYYPYIGARIISNATDVFVFPGDGETAFLKYTVSSGTWSNITNTPFPQHYGTDVTYNSTNSKIYAIAGMYKDETWEYDIANDSWRKIPNNQKFTFGRGPERGASIEFAGGNSIYATIGQGVALPSASADMWSYTVPDSNFSIEEIHTYTSQKMDFNQISNGISFDFNQDKPANTDVVYEMCSNSDGGDCTSWHNVTDGDISDHDGFALERYAWVKITLSTTDGMSTPTVNDFTVFYASDDTLPSVPENLVALSQEGGEAISSDTKYIYEHPHFSWSAAENNDSGVAGYYVYFGKNSEADPEISGVYQTANYYTVNEAMVYDTEPINDFGTYHLIIKAKDNNNLVSQSWTPFIYKYSGVSPTQTILKDLQEDFNKTGADFDEGKISYDSLDGSLRLDNVSGFWNQTRLSAAPYYRYIGSESALGECKTIGEENFNGNHCLYSFQGNNQLVFMRYEIETDTWISSTGDPNEIAPSPSGVHGGGSITEGPEGYLYATTGTLLPSFWRYDIANHEWLQLDDAPKNFTYGAVLSYDGNRYIYAMPGADDANYRFDTCNGQEDCIPEWTQLKNANFGNPNTSNGQGTSYGADSIYDGRNNIYVTQGGLYPYFAKYSIADDSGEGEIEDTWTSLASAPIGFYMGGSMEFDGDNSIYVLAGNNRNKFMKYDIDTNSWSFMPDAPMSIYYGASLKYYDGYIYTNPGGSSTSFYRFNTNTNTWELPNRDFFGPHNVSGAVYFPFTYGALMANDDSGNIYLGRGGYDNLFGKYNTTNGSFTPLANLPIGSYDGSNIVYDSTDNVIYYVSGSGIRTRRTGGDTNNPYFYKYDIATNIWEEITTDRPLEKIYTGSSMTYDGSRYIYLTQGNGTALWWRYDTQGTVGGRWTAMDTGGSCNSGNGSKIIYKDGDIYKIQAGASRVSCKFSGGAWSTLNLLPANINYGASLIDGNDGYLYVTQGGNTNPTNYYRYDTANSGADWETLDATVPGQVTYGGIGTNTANQNWVITGAGGGITYADGLYNYVVGSSSNGTGFEKTGTYISEEMDLIQAYRWANLTANYSLPINTSLEIQTRTSEDASVWGSWATVSDDHNSGDQHIFSINSEPKQYIQVKIIFSSSDQIFSPTLNDFAINYYQDISAPTNPTEVLAYDNSGKINSLTSGAYYNYATPYFEWPEADTAGGAVDNQGGSGVEGYYVYFGTEQGGEPVAFQEENNYTASNLVSGATYYLRIQTRDKAGMIPTEIFSAFTYEIDSVVPTNPTGITVSPTGYSSATEYVFTWDNDALDDNSGILKFQYKTGDPEDSWHDILDPYAVSQSASPYRSNKNTFYLRTVDNAGNISSPISMDYFWNGGAASPPTGLFVTPEDEENVTNQFTFGWDLPESYAGDPTKITYYYSINYLPTPFNSIETTARSAGPGPFATQFGKNTIYIVSMSEGGIKTNPTDVDWDNPASINFYAKTTAPGPPINNQIFDTSDREAQEYSVAIKWSSPLSYDSGNFSGYIIYRSADGENFSEIATTTGNAYVDTGIDSQLYYYYVKSRDKTNNLSTPTSTLSIVPTGRYLSPPTIVTKPAVSAESFAATITWATNRVASSFIEYGTSVSLGKTNGQVDSVTSHEVRLDGLEAAKKYYYKVKYIDPDGNIGTSEIDNFSTDDPPTISDVLVDGIGLDSAVISWSTNMSGTCTLKYGEGSFNNSNKESGSSTTHIQKISSLKPATSFIYQIDCLDSNDNSFNSDQYTFKTLEQPRVENFTAQNKEKVDLPTIELAYNTTHPTSTLVKFKGENEASYHNYLVNDLVTEHTAILEGLDPAIKYEVIASGIDADGIEAAVMQVEVTTLTDSRPPAIITNRSVGRVVGRGKDAKANLYVKIETDEVTTAKVLFGKGTILNNFEQSTAVDPANTYHLITIPVEPGQVYSYAVEAVDMAENKTITNAVTVVVEDSKKDATEMVVSTFSNKFGWVAKIWNP